MNEPPFVETCYHDPQSPSYTLLGSSRNVFQSRNVFPAVKRQSEMRLLETRCVTSQMKAAKNQGKN